MTRFWGENWLKIKGVHTRAKGDFRDKNAEWSKEGKEKKHAKTERKK